MAQRVQKNSGVFGILMFTLRREQGCLQEIAPLIRYAAQQQAVSAAWRPGLALIYCELGLEQEARAEFESLARDDFADVPKDTLWLACLAYLTEVCAFLGDTRRAVILHQLLLPYADRNLVMGDSVVCYGSVSRCLGLLATTLSDWSAAEQHFEIALSMNARIQARP